MALFRNTIVDAFGKRFPLIRHEIVGPLLSDDAKRDRLTKAGYADMAKGMPVRRSTKMYTVMVLLIAVAAMAPTIVIFSLDLPKWTWTALALWPAISCGIIVTLCMRHFAKHELVGVYLRARYCASCGYDLANARADGEGITTCPECGAAWALDRE